MVDAADGRRPVRLSDDAAFRDRIRALTAVQQVQGVNPESVAEADVVVARTAAVLRRSPETPVLVKADTRVPYGEVVTAMVLLQQAGAEQVGFVTDPLEELPVIRE